MPGPSGSEASDTPGGRIITSLCEPLGVGSGTVSVSQRAVCSLKKEQSLQALQSYFALH